MPVLREGRPAPSAGATRPVPEATRTAATPLVRTGRADRGGEATYAKAGPLEAPGTVVVQAAVEESCTAGAEAAGAFPIFAGRAADTALGIGHAVKRGKPTEVRS